MNFVISLKLLDLMTVCGRWNA